MNNDLISREALKNEVDTWGCNDYDKYDFIEAIDNAPTVKTYCYFCGQTEHGQIEERPQGEWVVTAEDNHGVHRICCPFCHYEKGRENSSIIIITFTKFPNFCENCGAELKGGAKNV